MKPKNYLKSMAGLASLVAAGLLLCPSGLQAGSTANTDAINAKLLELNPGKSVAILAVPAVKIPKTAAVVAATGVQLQAAIAAVLASPGHLASNGLTLLNDVLALEGTDKLRSAVAAGVVNGVLQGISGLSPSTNDYLAIANAGATASYLRDNAANSVKADTLQKTVIVSVMNATLVSGTLLPKVLLVAPDFTVANALAAYVSGATFGTSATDAGINQKVAILSDMVKAVPAATKPLSLTVLASLFPLADRTAAVTALAKSIEASSVTAAGVITGRLARTQSANLVAIASGVASNYASIADKVTLATSAASQHGVATATLPLGALFTDAVKASIATGISNAVNGTDTGKIVAAVGNTMALGDGLLQVDIRRGTLAAVVIKVDYTRAAALVQQMLIDCQLTTPAAMWGTSTTVTVAAKFATTLTAAVPAVKANVMTLADRSTAVTGEVVSINDQYSNTNNGLAIKVAVGQAVILANATLAQNIAQAVANEAFTNEWTGGNVSDQKVAFVLHLALGLKDANIGFVAAGAALADPTLAGLIVRQVGTAALVPTVKTKVAVAVAVMKALKANTALTDTITRDIASTGAGFSIDPLVQADFASQLIAGLTAKIGFAGYNAVTPISNAIATTIYNGGAGAVNASLFVAKLAGFQAKVAANVGTLVTAVAPIFGVNSIVDLAHAVTVAAPLDAVVIATAAAGVYPAKALDVAFDVSTLAPKLASTVGNAVMNLTLTALDTKNSYVAGSGAKGFVTARATDYAAVTGTYSAMFKGSAVATLKTAALDMVTGATTRAAVGVASTNLNDIAKAFGEALKANSVSSLVNLSATGIATKFGTTLEAAIVAPGSTVANGQLSEEFAAIAIALTHNMDKDVLTYIADIGKVLAALAKIDPQAAPDMLGVVLADMKVRGTITGLTDKNVKTLTTAATAKLATLDTKAGIALAVTDAFANNGIKYGTYGSITGEETPVHNQ